MPKAMVPMDGPQNALCAIEHAIRLIEDRSRLPGRDIRASACFPAAPHDPSRSRTLTSAPGATAPRPVAHDEASNNENRSVHTETSCRIGPAVLQTLTHTRRQNDGDEKSAGLIAPAAQHSNGASPRTGRSRGRGARLRHCARLEPSRGADGASTQYGPNRLKSAPETPWWRRLLEQFESFLVIILLVATVISMVEWLLQDPRETALPYEAIVILAIVVLNALLGFFQEVAGREVGPGADGPCRPRSDGGSRRRAPARRGP